MSYYNQPDHELIDRRNDEARALLLRLAQSTTRGLEPRGSTSSPTEKREMSSGSDGVPVRWFEQASFHGLPTPDAEPLALNDALIPLVWREHYVVALFEGDANSMTGFLEGKGFELLVFGRSESDWSATFTRLAAALGRTS
jgi:hypothetical protein